jgi:DNA-binding protein H-NS
MAKTYAQLSREIEALQAKADAVRKREASGVVTRIKEAIAAYGLTAEDLGLAEGSRARKGAARKAARPKVAGKRTPSKKSAVAVKYRDEAGNTWTGRGSRPRWLTAALAEGRALESFAVEAVDSQPPTNSNGSARSTTQRPRKAAKARKAASAVKYEDDAGHTWSGRGPQPGWLKAAIANGKTLHELAA